MAARAQEDHKRGLCWRRSEGPVLQADHAAPERAGGYVAQTADGPTAASRACGRWHRSAAKSPARDRSPRYADLVQKEQVPNLCLAHGDEHRGGLRIHPQGRPKRPCARQPRGCDRLRHDGDPSQDGYGTAARPTATVPPRRGAGCRVGGIGCEWNACAYASKWTLSQGEKHIKKRAGNEANSKQNSNGQQSRVLPVRSFRQVLFFAW